MWRRVVLAVSCVAGYFDVPLFFVCGEAGVCWGVVVPDDVPGVFAVGPWRARPAFWFFVVPGVVVF